MHFAFLNCMGARSSLVTPHLVNQTFSIKNGGVDQSARKSCLHLLSRNCHLRGISGPGAPHVFAFDRRADLIDQGRLRCVLHSKSVVNPLFFPSRFSEQQQIYPFGFEIQPAGVDLSNCQSRFWRKFGVAPEGDDVILRPSCCWAKAPIIARQDQSVLQCGVSIATV